MRRLASFAALLMATVSGCGGSSPPATSAVGTLATEPSGTATTEQPIASAVASASQDAGELTTGSLRPGTYVASEFALPFTVTITEDDPRWGVQWATPHLVNMGTLGSELQIFVSPEVHENGQEATSMPAPDNVLDWLMSLPGLEVVETGPVDIGNLMGTGVQLRPTGSRPVFLVPPPDPDAANPQPYGWSINPGGEPAVVNEFTHAFVDQASDEGPLWVSYYTETEAFLPAMRDLLAKLQFDTE